MMEPHEFGVWPEAVVDLVCQGGAVLVRAPVLRRQVHGVGVVRVVPVQVDHVVGGPRLASLSRPVDEPVMMITDDRVGRNFSSGE